MKLYMTFSLLVLLINSNFIQCAQAAQHSLIPTFTWTNNKKNIQGTELTPEAEFVNLINIINILSLIAKEEPAQNHWIFSSTNMPNFKLLKIQKTDPTTKETKLATYKIV